LNIKGDIAMLSEDKLPHELANMEIAKAKVQFRTVDTSWCFMSLMSFIKVVPCCGAVYPTVPYAFASLPY